MRPVISYDKFRAELYEGRAGNYSSQWPSDWKSLPLWKNLEDLGFYDATKDLQSNIDTIMLKNDSRIFRSFYPAGVVLQKSGYIRDKGVRSGFIKKYEGDFKLEDLLQYIKDRWTKEKDRVLNLNGRGPLNDDQCIFIGSCTGSKWKWNPTTNSVDVSGEVRIILEYTLFDSTKDTDWYLSQLGTFKFGKIGGDFVLYVIGRTLDSIEDFGPSEVKGDIRISGPAQTHSGVKSAKGFPSVIKGKVYLNEQIKDIRDLPSELLFFSTHLFNLSPLNVRTALAILKNGSASINVAPDGSIAVHKLDRGDSKAKELISTFLYVERVAEYIKENPLEMYLLDDFPDMKKKVLEITGLRDLSRLGKARSLGLI